MTKYGKNAQTKVKRAMHERKIGTLKSGRSGKKITSRKQAIAIALSEARKAGAKVPPKGAGLKRRRLPSRARRLRDRTAAPTGARECRLRYARRGGSLPWATRLLFCSRMVWRVAMRSGSPAAKPGYRRCSCLSRRSASSAAC